MTREHIFFVPIMFFLGAAVGSVVTRYVALRQSVPLQQTRVSERSVLVTLALLLALFAATHLFGMHGGPQAVQAQLGGMQLFDQRPSFSAAEVYARTRAFGEQGRAVYAKMALTSDLVFPMVIFAFLLQLTRFVSERAALSSRRRRWALILPAAWLLSDVLENVTIHKLLESFPERHDLLASCLGPLTDVKFTLLLASLCVPALISILIPVPRPNLAAPPATR